MVRRRPDRRGRAESDDRRRSRRPPPADAVNVPSGCCVQQPLQACRQCRRDSVRGRWKSERKASAPSVVARRASTPRTSRSSSSRRSQMRRLEGVEQRLAASAWRAVRTDRAAASLRRGRPRRASRHAGDVSVSARVGAGEQGLGARALLVRQVEAVGEQHEIVERRSGPLTVSNAGSHSRKRRQLRVALVPGAVGAAGTARASAAP